MAFALLIVLDIGVAQSRIAALPTVADAKVPLHPPFARAARVQGVVRVKVTNGGQQTRIEVTAAGKKKVVSHFENGPPEVVELERKLEVLVNTHQWLHGDAGPFSRGPDDLKNSRVVREDIYTGIKPGMTPLMRAAGRGDADAIQTVLTRGDEVSACDETGWTALMIAAAMGRNESVLALLKAHAPVDQQDRNGDTALLGASPFGSAISRRSRKWHELF